MNRLLLPTLALLLAVLCTAALLAGTVWLTPREVATAIPSTKRMIDGLPVRWPISSSASTRGVPVRTCARARDSS